MTTMARKLRTRPARRPGRLRQRGVALVEYLEILLLVTLGAAVAMGPLGAYLLRYYDNVEFLTGLPFP